MDMVFQQAGESLKTFSPAEKEALVFNMVESLMFIDEDVQEKVIACLRLVNQELGEKIQKKLQI